MTYRTAMNENDLAAFEPETKVALLATVSPEGLPHVTLITSLQGLSAKEIIWGQFSKGLSKTHVRANPKTGFLILTMDKRFWRGKARWTKEEKQGLEYDMYNRKPMFRYNAYLGIHTVHYMDLVQIAGPEDLPLPRIVMSSLLTRLAGGKGKGPAEESIMKPWAQSLLNSPGSLKFMAFVGPDGFPVMMPLLQCAAPDSRSLAFSTLACGADFGWLEPGASAAVFGLSMKMESVLLRGSFEGVQRRRGIPLGRISLDFVYNSMPPKQGRIYPMPEFEPVTEF